MDSTGYDCSYNLEYPKDHLDYQDSDIKALAKQVEDALEKVDDRLEQGSEKVFYSLEKVMKNIAEPGEEAVKSVYEVLKEALKKLVHLYHLSLSTRRKRRLRC